MGKEKVPDPIEGGLVSFASNKRLPSSSRPDLRDGGKEKNPIPLSAAKLLEPFLTEEIEVAWGREGGHWAVEGIVMRNKKKTLLREPALWVLSPSKAEKTKKPRGSG